MESVKSALLELYGMSSHIVPTRAGLKCEVSELDDILASLELEHDEIEVEDSQQHRYCQVRTTSKLSSR